MDLLRVSAWQTDIVWEDKRANLERLHAGLSALSGQTDVVVLPETFSTGFGAHVSSLAEPADGPTVQALCRWAARYGLAFAGSFLASDTIGGDSGGEAGTLYYNRAFFITPEGETFFADKRHLFHAGEGDEASCLARGTVRRTVSYGGWNILLLVCYDLRFPVWSRNVDNEYDLLIYVANWPASRRQVWDVLLPARAIENECYVCGVNRVGEDGHHIAYSGGSRICSPRGDVLVSVPDAEPGVVTATLSLPNLRAFRDKFPVWKDADAFLLK